MHIKSTDLQLSHIACPTFADALMQELRTNEVFHGEGDAVPCDAAIADVICHFPRQGQCC